jgi:hypothetical protein
MPEGAKRETEEGLEFEEEVEGDNKDKTITVMRGRVQDDAAGGLARVSQVRVPGADRHGGRPCEEAATPKTKEPAGRRRYN